MWALWWVWMAAAIVLGIIEVLAPGFIFLGFAIGAALISLLILFGGPGAAMMTGSLPILLVVFAVLSGIAYVVLRKAVGVQRGQVKTFDHDINE